MWKTHDDDDDHALFDSSAREELRFIVTLSVATLISVSLLWALAIKMTN